MGTLRRAPFPRVAATQSCSQPFASSLGRSCASIDRLRTESQGTENDLDLADGLLASSHRFARGAMALEAGLYGLDIPPLEALHPFAHSVNETINLLTARLRDGIPPAAEPPDLRDVHCRLVHALESHDGAAILVTRLTTETKRVTNSLDTMADVIRKRPAPASTDAP
ncbi:MAG: hypothetical protein NVS2B16_17730 [Chloroflexota bacterium]